MMFKKKALAAALVAGLAVAGSANAIQVDWNGKGQVLLGPVYMVDQNHDSVIRVANTDTTMAVKARLALRSRDHSRECRDVILYLSPGDVAELRVSDTGNSADGTAKLYSDDDSLIGRLDGATPVFASTSPYQSTTVKDDFLAAAQNDSCKVGHVEVVGVYGVRGTVQTNAGAVVVKQGMTKGDLYKIFSEDRASLNAKNTVGTTITSLNVNSLVGVVDLVKADGSDRTAVPFVGLRNEVAAPLITNENLDTFAAAAMDVGIGYLAGELDARDSINAALATASLQSIYDNSATDKTNIVVTFPLKYRYLTSAKNAQTISYAPPFQSNGSYQYNVVSFDMRENSRVAAGCFESPCPTARNAYMTAEVNYIFTTGIANFFNADRGWFSLNFAGNPGLAAVIALNHRVSGTQSVAHFLAR